ncbi:MAG: HNH/ENDO VII family nuclease [Treponemataceae bacterium]|nr:HNH/ENDO VII family nuclease [Treponemataceae bacterium]
MDKNLRIDTVTVYRSNIERMKKGIAPIGPDEKSVNLHHTKQTMDGSVQELTATKHQENYMSLHSNTGQSSSLINRQEFAKWRRDYWKTRANDFLNFRRNIAV